ncbi:TolB family protein [Paenibacillus abyssi]|uniref:Lipoprotein LpqB beta-propeller domain-containing protein n=1 Tax=Paenibacillus abyssi TaxID=1340531 RepID=A0A917CTB7_9BACL|nr:PD40 domain-containing protein [Paenibacillus abyssi]GGF96476.1 hypothetical protein GCM10010916_12140 [Paenibacillus abyssi]
MTASNMKRMVLACAAACLMAAAAAGCSQPQAEERQVIEKPGKEITVIDNKEQQRSDEVVVDHINEIEGVSGMDWISEEEIIISKDNFDMDPLNVEGQEMYPKNLYVHHLGGEGESTGPLQAARINQGFAMLSPDKKFLFYKESIEETAYGMIMNMATKESVKLSDDPIPVYEGEWMDSENVIFSTVDGKLYTANITGDTELAADTGDYAFDAQKVGNRIYYIGSGNVLYMIEGQSEEPRKLMDEVVWIIPSPDSQQLALVKRTSETEMTLLITDLDGKEKTTLTMSTTQIFGTSWSPDGTRLVYNAISETGGDKGVFVADAVTGKITQIAVDMEYAANTLRWSPSGKQIMTTSTKIVDNAYQFVTHIITLK